MKREKRDRGNAQEKKHNRHGGRSARGILLVSAALLLCMVWVSFSQLFCSFEEKARVVEIPDLTGRSLYETELPDWIEPKIEYRYDAASPRGTVLLQSPAAGSRRKLRAEDPVCRVTLTVSQGRETVVLPDLFGEDGALAANRLREMGLLVEIVEKSSIYPVGSVFEIEPFSVGEELPSGSLIRLFVSTGLPQRSVEVPSLEGLWRSDALVRLWMSELSVASVEEIVSDRPVGTVVRQSHRPGTLVPVGTGIILYVSTGETRQESSHTERTPHRLERGSDSANTETEEIHDVLRLWKSDQGSRGTVYGSDVRSR